MHTSQLLLHPLFFVALGGAAVAVLGCGDEEGPATTNGGQLTLSERDRAVGLARSRARCRCETGSYASNEACAERFAFGPEYLGCNLDAWEAAGRTTEEVECFVQAGEAQIACYQGIDGCDQTAIQACDDAVDASTAACNPAFADIPPDAYFDDLDACVAAEVVGPATGCAAGSPSAPVGPAAFSGSAVGRGDDVAPSCDSATSADVEHAWTAPTTGRYRFTTDGTVAEAAVVVLDGCGGAELACDAWTDDAPNRQAVVELDVVQGQTYVLVVDFAFDSTVGPYQLNITAL